MKNYLFISKILFLVFLLLSALNAVELDWEHDYKKALITAKKENKMVYFFIGADQCRHCERFKKNTLSNKNLIKTMEKDYVLLYMSRDQHEVPEGFEKFGVPMHYFLTHEGNITAVIQGGRELDGWYDVLDEIDLLKDI